MVKMLGGRKTHSNKGKKRTPYGKRTGVTRSGSKFRGKKSKKVRKSRNNRLPKEMNLAMALLNENVVRSKKRKQRSNKGKRRVPYGKRTGITRSGAKFRGGADAAAAAVAVSKIAAKLGVGQQAPVEGCVGHDHRTQRFPDARCSTSRSRDSSEYSICKETMSCSIPAARINLGPASESPRNRILPSSRRRAMPPIVSSMGKSSCGRAGQKMSITSMPKRTRHASQSARAASGELSNSISPSVVREMPNLEWTITDIHTALYAGMQGIDGIGVARRSIAARHAHAAEAEDRNFYAGISQWAHYYFCLVFVCKGLAMRKPSRRENLLGGP